MNRLDAVGPADVAHVGGDPDLVFPSQRRHSACLELIGAVAVQVADADALRVVIRKDQLDGLRRV